jgi:hypothetical protein
VDQVTEIYQALNERLTKKLALKTWLRVPARADECPTQPAGILLEADGAQDFGDEGAPDMTSLGADLTIYFQGEGEWPGATALELLRKVRRALRWQPTDDGEPGDGYATTLGGLVNYARVVGWDVMQSPTVLPQWGISIEIEMLAADVDRDEET